MGLLDELKAKDKAGLFTSNDNKVSYLTGILPLDYANGYWQQIVDEKGNKKVVPVLGVTGGSFTSLIGGTGSGKTTFADQIAFNMIKPYSDGLMFHIDAEKTAIKQRMINVTSRDMSDPRIILKTENTSIEDVLIMFDQVCEIKEAGRD
jgi:ABC-type glutathione transport system ATPase component